MTFDLLQTFKVKGSEVKVTAWSNGGKKLLNYQQLSRGLFDFNRISYRLWPHGTWCTTDLQCQRIKGQGHSVTQRISIRNRYISRTDRWLSLNFVKIIPEHSGICVQGRKIKYSNRNRNLGEVRARSLDQMFSKAHQKLQQLIQRFCSNLPWFSQGKFGIVFNIIQLWAARDWKGSKVSETKLQHSNYRPMSSASLVKLGPCTPDKLLSVVLHSL